VDINSKIDGIEVVLLVGITGIRSFIANRAGLACAVSYNFVVININKESVCN